MKDTYTKINGHDDKLKPCPFCGSRAELWQYQDAPEASAQKVVMCSNSGDENHDGECEMYMSNEAFHKATKREAIAAWNKRPNHVENITDTERLNWLIENSALVRIGGEKSPDPYYFIAYKNGTTGDSYPTPLQAIDAEIRGLT